MFYLIHAHTRTKRVPGYLTASLPHRAYGNCARAFLEASEALFDAGSSALVEMASTISNSPNLTVTYKPIATIIRIYS